MSEPEGPVGRRRVGVLVLLLAAAVIYILVIAWFVAHERVEPGGDHPAPSSNPAQRTTVPLRPTAIR